MAARHPGDAGNQDSQACLSHVVRLPPRTLPCYATARVRSSLGGDASAPIVQEVGDRLLERDARLPAELAPNPARVGNDLGNIDRSKPRRIDFGLDRAPGQRE